MPVLPQSLATVAGWLRPSLRLQPTTKRLRARPLTSPRGALPEAGETAVDLIFGMDQVTRSLDVDGVLFGCGRANVGSREVRTTDIAPERLVPIDLYASSVDKI